MAEDFRGINQETLKNVEALKGSMKDIADATTSANKQLQQQVGLIQDYRSNFSSIVTSASQFAKLQDEASRSASATSKALSEQQKQLSNVRSLNAQIENLMDQMVIANEKEVKLLQRQVNNLSAARDNAEELANAYGELVDSSSKLDKSTMWFSAFSEVVKDIPGLRKLSSPFEAAAKAARETAITNAKNQLFLDEALKSGKGLTKEKIKELGLEKEAAGLTGRAAAARLKTINATAKTQSTSIAGMQAGFKALGPIIKGAIVPLAILQTLVDIGKFFVQAMFEADKRITDLSRNLQISKDEARGIDEFFKSIKGSLETQYNLTKNIYQAQSELSELSAASVLFSKETLDAQIQLTKEYGLQAQDAANLNKIFITNDEVATDALHTAAKTTSQFFKQTKVLMSERKLLEQASKVSGQLLVSFKGSTKELINAVAKANLLGITLEKARNISMSMLNFEESISSELEAELLTGKDLNFERARSLSLQGKFVEAAEEAVKQVGTLERFQNMNVIAQQAIAKAAGLTVDELSDALIQQKLIDKDAKAQFARLKEAGQDELARRFALGKYDDKEIEAANKRINAQEKFNLALDKIKEVFTDLVDGGILDALSNAAMAFADTVASGGSLFSLFGKSDLEKNIEKKSLETAKQTVKDLTDKRKEGELSDTEIKRLVEAQNRISESEPKVNRMGVRLKDTETADDFIIRPGQKPLKFRKDDVVIGGTNLGGGNGEVVSLLKELITAVKSGGDVYLDGTKVGTAMAVSSFKVQ